MMNQTQIKNWAIGNRPSVLDQIHDSSTNIAIYNRDTSYLNEELDTSIDPSIEIELSGKADEIVEGLKDKLEDAPLIKKDIIELIHLFQKVAKTDNIKLRLVGVNTNMCRKFHSDINDLRMLCTYSGPGTLWLKDETVNREALVNMKEDLLAQENKVEQVDTGSVVILKGALYPSEYADAIIHRSPSIEESSKHRLLLRLDTNAFLNFDL